MNKIAETSTNSEGFGTKLPTGCPAQKPISCGKQGTITIVDVVDDDNQIEVRASGSQQPNLGAPPSAPRLNRVEAADLRIRWLKYSEVQARGEELFGKMLKLLDDITKDVEEHATAKRNIEGAC